MLGGGTLDRDFNSGYLRFLPALRREPDPWYPHQIQLQHGKWSGGSKFWCRHMSFGHHNTIWKDRRVDSQHRKASVGRKMRLVFLELHKDEVARWPTLDCCGHVVTPVDEADHYPPHPDKYPASGIALSPSYFAMNHGEGPRSQKIVFCLGNQACAPCRSRSRVSPAATYFGRNKPERRMV